MARIGTNDGEQTTVVHVDPNSHVPESLDEHLETEGSGFEVVSATSAQDALARLEAFDVDCLVDRRASCRERVSFTV